MTCVACVEIRCRDCDRLISTCRCVGDKRIALHQCRDCEAQDVADEAAVKTARQALRPGAVR